MAMEGIRPRKKRTKKSLSSGGIPIVGVGPNVSYYDSKDGTLLREESLSEGGGYLPYDKERVEMFLQLISSGLSVKKSLGQLNIPYTSYIRWRAERPEFGSQIESARTLRAEAMNEEHYERDILRLLETDLGEMKDPSFMSSEEKKEHLLKLDILKKGMGLIRQKQEVIHKALEKEAPSRYSKFVRMDSGHSIASLEIEFNKVPEEMRKLVEGYRPEISSEGGLVVRGLEKKVKEFIEAEAVERKGGVPESKKGSEGS